VHPATFEDELKALCAAGELAAAAGRAVESYGPEVLGFLVATLRDEELAGEAFARAAEALWKGLASFRFEATVRTWFYTLGRNAAARVKRDQKRRREDPLDPSAEIVAAVRSRTMAHLRTEVKDRFAEIRASLDPDDQALLVLRVDRGLEWSEVARVMAGDDEDLRRVAARLRKRFQLLKDELRRRAVAAGLVES
jgi:RNA polymerase sigma-70 factor (ECF subfamily)